METRHKIGSDIPKLPKTGSQIQIRCRPCFLRALGYFGEGDGLLEHLRGLVVSGRCLVNDPLTRPRHSLAVVERHHSALVDQQRIAIAHRERRVERFVGEFVVGEQDMFHAYE